MAKAKVVNKKPVHSKKGVKAPSDVKKEDQVNKAKEGKSDPHHLFEGMAEPYIAFFDQTGGALVNPITQIPLGAYITSFQLKMSEGKEDYGSIQIDTGDPDTVDISDIQPGDSIMVQYGYIFPTGEVRSSKPRRLKIMEVNQSFDETGTHAVLSIKDSVTDLRHSVPFRPAGEDHTLLKYMENGFNNEVGIIIEKFE